MDKGRIVIVTGADGGIGSALVGRFLDDGDTVVALDRGPGTAVAGDRPPAASSRLLRLEGDITDEGDCVRVAGVVRDRFGHVDVLVNCAGYFPTGPLESMTLTEWRRVIDVNLTGVFLMTREVTPLMRPRGWGRSINIGAASGFRGPANRAHYGAAKAGVIGFSRSLASELGPVGITVNVVAPGLTLTDAVLADTPAELIRMVRENRPVRRDQTAGDVVGAVAFLASPSADFISGQVLCVDGGFSKP